MNKIDEIYYELEGVHHDLTHQFDPKDGGVCARTIKRVQKMLDGLCEKEVTDATTRDEDASTDF